jgi:hypothetical protein
MALADFIQRVESEWQPDTGFFWKVRQGIFDKSDFNRALSQVASVPSPNGEPLPARLVSLLWYIPIFMEWQRDRVRENGGDVGEFAFSANKLTTEVERILGVP